jgi:hypothetical protein
MKAQMKKNLSLCGLTLALLGGASSANAGGFAYSYSSPVVSVYAGAQLGNNKTTNVNQNSAVNISSVTQVGNNVTTHVVQNGASNTSAITQHGHQSTATVVQFGNGGSGLGAP